MLSACSGNSIPGIAGSFLGGEQKAFTILFLQYACMHFVLASSFFKVQNFYFTLGSLDKSKK